MKLPKSPHVLLMAAVAAGLILAACSHDNNVGDTTSTSAVVADVIQNATSETGDPIALNDRFFPDDETDETSEPQPVT